MSALITDPLMEGGSLWGFQAVTLHMAKFTDVLQKKKKTILSDPHLALVLNARMCVPGCLHNPE